MANGPAEVNRNGRPEVPEPEVRALLRSWAERHEAVAGLYRACVEKAAAGRLWPDWAANAEGAAVAADQVERYARDAERCRRALAGGRGADPGAWDAAVRRLTGWAAADPTRPSALPSQADGRSGAAPAPPPPAAPPAAFAAPVPASQLGAGGPPDWLWDGYLARGSCTLLLSLWKAGKTTLLAHLVAALGSGPQPSEPAAPAASGAQLAGRGVGRGNVLVVSEESARLWAGRRDKLGIGDHAHFDVRPFKGRPSSADWGRYAAHLAGLVRRLDLRLVVLDTLAALSPCDDENDAAKMMAALTPLHAVTEAGAAVLIVHHPRKGDGTEAQASRGSGALPGFVDVVLEVRRVKNAGHDCRKRELTAYSRFDDTPAELVIELAADGLRYEALGTPAEAVRDEAGRRKAERDAARQRQVRDDGAAVLLYLDAHDAGRDGVSCTRCRNALAWDSGRFGRAVQPLLDLGVVVECRARVSCGRGARDVPGIRRQPHRETPGD